MTEPAVRFVRSEPRWPLIRRGAAVAAVGLALLILGAMLFGGRDALALAAPAARGTIPGEVRFTARDGRYAILLNRLSPTGPPSSAAVAATTCTVGSSDESSLELRGSRQTSSTESSFGLSIGSFDGVAGPTTVACEYTTSLRGRSRFVVARRGSTVSVAIAALIGGGLLVGLAGAGLVTWGFRHPTVTRGV